MLRSELGDENFFSGIRDYYVAHRDSTATTEDLRALLRKLPGRTCEHFFKRWVYGAGHPNYDLTWEWLGKKKTVKLLLKQTQAGDAFPNSLPLEITTPPANIGLC